MRTNCDLIFSETSELIERQETSLQGTGSVLSQVKHSHLDTYTLAARPLC